MMKPGYKQTEIGVIPEDWEAKQIGSFARICMCKRVFTDQTAEVGDIPFYKIGTFGGKPDAYISRALYSEYKNKYSYPEKGDVLISAAGTLGRTVVFDGADSYFQDSNIVWLDIDKTQICNEYLKHFYEVIQWAASEGSTISRLYNGIIESTYVLVPPLAEQQRIAEALSDMDELIASLEKLIAKKKAIKQGAMQELLTGKRRLPGFSGEWEIRAISSLGKFVSGNGFPLEFQGHQVGKYPFYKVSDFNNIGNEQYLKRANNYISPSIAEKLKCNIIPMDSIVFAKIGAAIFLERKKLTTVECCIDNNTMSFQANDCVSPHFLWYVFQTIRFGDLVEATALPSLSGKSIGGISKLFPPTREEQEAIASVLLDIDHAIADTSQRLDKVRQIKNGMMQQLLTGKIRLR